MVSMLPLCESCAENTELCVENIKMCVENTGRELCCPRINYVLMNLFKTSSIMVISLHKISRHAKVPNNTVLFLLRTAYRV